MARGGIDLSASFNYRLEPAASVQVCTEYCTQSRRPCIGLYDSFPNNYLTLEAWYQLRRVRTCGRGWFVSIIIVFCMLLESRKVTSARINYSTSGAGT